jgi:hypothetical protein
VPQSTPDIVTKLADKGEEALQKIAGSQAAQKLLDALTNLKDRARASREEAGRA